MWEKGRVKKDISGNKYGYLTALRPSNESDYQSVYWFCKCDCGMDVYTVSRNLTRGFLKGCFNCHDNYLKLSKIDYINNILGETINGWLVLDYNKKINGNLTYLCKCTCGSDVEEIKYRSLLENGKYNSCKECREPIKRSPIATKPDKIIILGSGESVTVNNRGDRIKGQGYHTGSKYGKLTILSVAFRVKGRKYYHCLCECGEFTIRDSFKLGSSCGCVRPGKRGPNKPPKDILASIRSCGKYRWWKISILDRDMHKCVSCSNDKRLQVDHIYSISKIINENNIKTLDDALKCNLLWDISNGRVLCINCHKNTETYGNPKKVKS